MTSTCKVCTHSQRHVIDHELARDSSINALSAQFGLSRAALAAHFAGCLLGVAPEADKETARRAGVDAQRDAVGAFDAGALDALLDAVLQPQPSQSKGGR